MKKSFYRYLVLVLPIALLSVHSCNKLYHYPNPTPSNFRLSGFTVTTTGIILVPLSLTPVVTETYSFTYDGSNRLSQILYGTNDSNKYKMGLADLRMNFSYNGNVIYRTVTNLRSSNIVETDSFVLDANGYLLNSYFATEAHSFTYQGKLLTGETDTYSDTGTSVSATTTFTSDNNDILNQFFNGTLTATFPDSGIRPAITPLDTFRDSVLTAPLTVYWTKILPTKTSVTFDTTSHSAVNKTDIYNGYSEFPIVISAIDPNAIYVRQVAFPGGLAPVKSYHIYDFLPNRIGDYLQLQSFSTYGLNIYQNAHMLKSMVSSFDTTSVNYVIDGQSKVTQTTMTKTDYLGNTTTKVYKLQYDTY